MMFQKSKLIVFFAFLCVTLFVRESYAGEIIKYNLKEECGAYFESEFYFNPNHVGWRACDFKRVDFLPHDSRGISSYIYITEDIEKYNIYKGWHLNMYSYGFLYPISLESVERDYRKIIKRERIDSLKKTKKDKIIATLIKSKTGSYYGKEAHSVCIEGILFDKNSSGGAVVTLCNVYKKGTPLFSPNSWQAKLIKSLKFDFGKELYASTDCAPKCADKEVPKPPSFDCVMSINNYVEGMICDDKELSQLDFDLAKNFEALRAADLGTQREQLLADQRAWLKKSRSLRRKYDLKKSYIQRIEELCKNYPVKTGKQPECVRPPSGKK